jgi:hypothetical protein
MGRPERSPAGAKRSVSISVLVGLVLVPVSAYAASVLVGDRTSAEPDTSISAPVATPVADFDTETASAADLQAACGDAGLGMIAAEADGTIGDIEQAALDALREICAQQGMPLPGKTAPPPPAQTVVLTDNGPAPTVGSEVEWEVEYDDDRDDDDAGDDWDDDGEDHDDDDDEDDD